MPTAYIDITVCGMVRQIFLFETEVVAEVEYDIDGGELVDWAITAFKAVKEQIDIDRDTFVRRTKKLDECWVPDSFDKVLREFVDKDALEEKLVEQLYADGELYYADDVLRRDYHASVL